jgi:DNA modification methylase
MKYADFLATKKLIHQPEGINATEEQVHGMLFPFQRALTVWALKKGRCAVFADTGLGKTFIQLEWARLVGGRSLIIAPLSVARQTIKEAKKIGIQVEHRKSAEILADGINITNYEHVHKFPPEAFDSVVLDESSILKNLAGKYRQELTARFMETRFKLCCTATPAPNDIAEIGNHAEFLGIMSHQTMLSAFFVHDSSSGHAREGWRLKKHGVEAFYRWLASWSMSLRKPSELGYSDDGYNLPPLNIVPHFIEIGKAPEGLLFPMKVKGWQERQIVRRGTIDEKIEKLTEVMMSNGNAQWLVWCGLNDEAKRVSLELGAVNIQGSDSPEFKAESIEGFQDGAYPVLVTKPKIGGFGLNLQNCHNMAFFGLSDSFESFYQCIRRCWRFGQEKPVNVHIILTDLERTILENVKRKETESERMRSDLINHIRNYETAELRGEIVESQYKTGDIIKDSYSLMLGDSCERTREIKDESVHLSIFSPPFLSLYSYSPQERDLGNSEDADQFFEHFGFIIKDLLRVTMPGRVCCVHCAQVPLTKVHDGKIGLRDFRGDLIREFSGAGWVYHGEVCIDKDPQAQAIRTHSKGLLFVQMKRDASWLRPALADYVLIFRKPGDNPVPVISKISNDTWIEWARPIWYNIKETDTLNVREGKDKDDEKHICPLQLGTIKRLVHLFSNDNELILDPFAGIGSTGYIAVREGRRFVGVELKESYFDAMVKNMVRAKSLAPTLFD